MPGPVPFLAPEPGTCSPAGLGWHPSLRTACRDIQLSRARIRRRLRNIDRSYDCRLTVRLSFTVLMAETLRLTHKNWCDRWKIFHVFDTRFFKSGIRCGEPRLDTIMHVLSIAKCCRGVQR